MMHNWFFAFFTLCEILKIASCGNEPFNLGLQLSKDTEVESTQFPKNQDKFIFEDNAVTSEERSLKKKRLFFPDGDTQGEIHPDKYLMNGEQSSKRRYNQSKIEDQQNQTEDKRNFANNHWENERNRYFHSEEKENVGSSMEFYPRQPIAGANHNRFDWEKKGISEKSQSLWNERKDLKQFISPNSGLRVGGSYHHRPPNGLLSDYAGGRNSNVFDGRISLTTLNDADVRNMNKYSGDYRMDEMHSAYQTHSERAYNNRKDGGFWERNFHKPEKGVIINFNTDCPATRQFNNQLVHRVIVSPKSPVAQSEVSTYHFPGSGLITAHQLTPAYYM